MPISSELKTEEAVVLEINELVDTDLMEKLGDFLNGLPSMQQKNVAATLAAMTADALSGLCESHPEVCVLSGSFSCYIHQFAHWSFDENKKTTNH
jgi:hypothetical protein